MTSGASLLTRSLQLCPDTTKPIIVAVSGGLDSMYLASLLHSILPSERMVIAHFDHGVRPGSADDAQWVRDWADQRGIPFALGKGKDLTNDENALRIARHAFLQTVKQNHSAHIIALAHHSDDSAETILHNFLRGSGPRGLSGLPEWVPATSLWRPLVAEWREDIEKHAKELGVEWREDETNADEKYTRNYLRHTLLPLLDQRYPRLKHRLTQQGVLFQRSHDCVLRMAQAFVTQHGAHFPRDLFAQLHVAVQGEVLRLLWQPRSLNFTQTDALRVFALDGASGKQMQTSGRALRVYSGALHVLPLDEPDAKSDKTL